MKLYFWAYKDGNKWRLDTVAKTEAEADDSYRFCGGHKKVFAFDEDAILKEIGDGFVAGFICSGGEANDAKDQSTQYVSLVRRFLNV